MRPFYTATFHGNLKSSNDSMKIAGPVYIHYKQVNYASAYDLPSLSHLTSISLALRSFKNVSCSEHFQKCLYNIQEFIKD